MISGKKLVSIILALVLVITVLPATARAEDDVVEPDPMTETMEQPVTEIAAEQVVNEEPAAGQEEPELTSQAVVPGNISGLTAVARSDGSVKLTWNKAANAYKYLIYRSTTKSGGYKVVRKQRASSYADTAATGLKPSTRYYYKVVPYTQDNVRGRSSNPVTVVTKAASPGTRILSEQEKKFIGVWWLNTGTDPVTGLSTRHFWYEFKSDGTFYFSITEDGSYVLKDVQSQTGNFRVEGDKLYYTNVKGTKIRGENTEYTNKPQDNYSQPYRFFIDNYDRESLTIGTLDVYKKTS